MFTIVGYCIAAIWRRLFNKCMNATS